MISVCFINSGCHMLSSLHSSTILSQIPVSVSPFHWIKYLLSSHSVSRPRKIVYLLFAKLWREKNAKLLLHAKAIHVTQSKSNHYLFILCVLYSHIEEVKNYVKGCLASRGPPSDRGLDLRKDGWLKEMFTFVREVWCHNFKANSWDLCSDKFLTNTPREAEYWK